MKKHAVIVHLDALPVVTPLVGGYLKAFAEADPAVRDDWTIELYSAYVQTPAGTVLRALAERRPDVLAFSTYTWNVGLVRRLVEALQGLLPRSTRFLLGGVEVIDSAATFVDPKWHDVAVCNGEGERTFHDYLLEVATERPDLAKVGGLSFFRDGDCMTTPPFPRIKDLSAIPSPWLNDVFTPAEMAEVALFETNRGCPFACEFCYWGGAVGQKVHKLEGDRIREEITYIAKHRTKALSICDANFGMIARDIGLAEHIVAMKERHKFPTRVLYSSSKNDSERAVEIARIFTKGGLLHTQSISLQSMSGRALALARRSNIKTEAYLSLQRRLNEWNVPSFVELIWPLPGETLESFKAGVDRLCRMGAQGFAVYPLLWLKNVGYEGRQEELGVTTLPEEDIAGGGRIVLQTNEVTFPEFLEGLGFATALYLLFDCRGLHLTTRLADALGAARFRDVIDDFVAWMDRRAGDDPVTGLWRTARDRFEDAVKFVFRGAIADAVLHGARGDFDRLLAAFVADHPGRFGGEHAELLAAAFELDLLSRPYAFFQTPFRAPEGLRVLEVVDPPERRRWDVTSPYDFPRILERLRAGAALEPADLERGAFSFRVDHKTKQIFRLASKSAPEHQWHCHQIVRGIGSIEPRYGAAV